MKSYFFIDSQSKLVYQQWCVCWLVFDNLWKKSPRCIVKHPSADLYNIWRRKDPNESFLGDLSPGLCHQSRLVVPQSLMVWPRGSWSTWLEHWKVVHRHCTAVPAGSREFHVKKLRIYNQQTGKNKHFQLVWRWVALDKLWPGQLSKRSIKVQNSRGLTFNHKRNHINVIKYTM